MRSTPSRLVRAAVPALLALVAACGERGGDAAPPPGGPSPDPVDVQVERAATGTAPRRLRALGTLLALEEVTVAAEVAGRLVAVLHDVGDRVAPGTVLARVDDSDLSLEVDERRRAVQETLAKLGLSALPDGELDLAPLPAVEAARIAAENARSRFERAQSLHERTPPLVSKQDVDDLRAAWEVADRQRDAAALAARALLAEARTRQAQLARAEDRLRRSVVLAPAGVRPAVPGSGDAPSDARDELLVAERRVSAGDYVAAGYALFRLVDADPLQLRLAVPERRIAGVTPGLRVVVSLAGQGAPVEGRVARVRPEVDPRTRSYHVDVLVPNADARIPVGAFATAEIEIGEDAGLVLVPETAVRTFAGVQRVLVVKDGKAAERPVTVGRRVGGRLELTSGLAAGEAYVADPPPGLAAGAPVRVTERAAEGAGPR